MSNQAPIPILARQLRNEAAVRLNNAARCSNPARRDTLVGEALVLLARAREVVPPDPGVARRPGPRLASVPKP